MQLTETQIKQANDLIKRYGFPSLETQKQLQENGFFEAVNCPFGISEYGVNQMEIVIESDFSPFSEDVLRMPQFHGVWAVLPDEILSSNKEIFYHKRLTVYGISYGTDTYNHFFSLTETTIIEAACLLWLELKKENLL